MLVKTEIHHPQVYRFYVYKLSPVMVGLLMGFPHSQCRGIFHGSLLARISHRRQRPLEEPQTTQCSGPATKIPRFLADVLVVSTKMLKYSML